MQLATLLEDPEGATVLRLAREAHAALRDRSYGGGHAAGSGAGAGRQAARSAWIAPAPASVRMRLFCLPYAGGVSENVFARRARTCCISAFAPLTRAWAGHLLLVPSWPAVSAQSPALGSLKPLRMRSRAAHKLQTALPGKCMLAKRTGGRRWCLPASRCAQWRYLGAGGARASPLSQMRPSLRACSRMPCPCRRVGGCNIALQQQLGSLTVTT